MSILGVIGGLGPMAGVYFAEKVTEMTDAEKDQQHVKMVLYSAPDIPDRTDYILGKSQNSPLPGILEAGRALISLGADVIAIPCVTAHYFHREIAEGLSEARVLHVGQECAKLLEGAGVRRAGVAATEGTVKSGILQKTLAARGIETVVLCREGQDRVNALIYDCVKKGLPADRDAFFAVKEEFLRSGAQAVILGCTELSLLNREFDTGPMVLDCTEALARAAVLACGKKLRGQFEKLI